MKIDKLHSKGKKIWQPALTVGDHTLESFGEKTSTNSRADNKYVVRDPTCDSSDPVVRAMYQQVCQLDNAQSKGFVLSIGMT